jgi:hypothetical protein
VSLQINNVDFDYWSGYNTISNGNTININEADLYSIHAESMPPVYTISADSFNY